MSFDYFSIRRMQYFLEKIKNVLGSAAYKNVPSSGNASTTEVVMGDDTRLTDSRTPTAHTQTSDTINAMTNYSKPQTTSAIITSDTLNGAIGKLEKALDNKNELFTITITGSEDPETGETTYVADKLPSEAIAAYNNGDVVQLVMSSENVPYYFTLGNAVISEDESESETGFMFQRLFVYDDDDAAFGEFILVKEQNVNAWDYIEFIHNFLAVGGNSLVAEITENNNVYTCNRTFEEVSDAYYGSKDIFIKFGSRIFKISRYESSTNTFYFTSTIANANGIDVKTFVMTGSYITEDWTSITLTESSGGSANAFLLTISYDEQTGEPSCDKLPSEVAAAYANGSIIQALVGDELTLDLVNCLLSASPYIAMFSNSFVRTDDTGGLISVTLQKNSSTDTWDSISIDDLNIEYLTATVSKNNNVYSCDKTPEAIDDALNYGFGVRLKYTEDDIVYDFKFSSQDDDGIFYFTSVNVDSSNELTVKTFAMTPNNDDSAWSSIAQYETNGAGDVIWTGTQAEYNAQASSIPNGTTVHITDDEEVISQIAIVDNLTTQDATKALSANQGYVLKQYLDNKADIFTITLTWTQDPQTGELTFTSDKLPSEVIAAKNSGNLIRLTATDTIDFYFNLIADSTTEESTAFIFSNFNTPSADYQVSYTGFTLIKAENSDTWASIEMISSEAKDTLTIEMEESSGVYSCDTDFDTLDDAYWHSINMFIDFNKEIFRLAKYDSLEDTFYFTNTMSDSSGVKTRTFVMVGDESENEWTSITLTESSGSGGASPSHMYIISSAGSEIEVETPSGETITPTQTTGSTTQWECDTTEFGEHAITVTLSSTDYTHNIDINCTEAIKVIYNATDNDWIDIRSNSGKPEVTMAQYNYLVANDLDEPDVDYHIKDASPVSAKNLDDLLDVQITSPSNGQALIYESSSSKWKNKTPAFAGIWTTAVSGSVGDTTITFTNNNITTTSILDLYSENESGTPVSYTSVEISAGEAEYTIPELGEATDFKLWIRNL